jgi:hypothetical protein
MSKEFLNIIFLFSLFLLLVFFPLKATAKELPLSGFAWSENIGWISFNCKDCENNPKCGKSFENKRCGEELIDYKVTIDDQGNFSGYAWSENIGWIKFDPGPDVETGVYPEEPQWPAKIVNWQGEKGQKKEVSGWVRACAGTIKGDCQSATRKDGWSGWIKLRGKTEKGEEYGVWLDDSLSPAEFKGWAWDSELIGWSSFNHSNEKEPAAVPKYKVILANQPPEKPEPEDSQAEGIENGIEWNHCAWECGRGFTPQVAVGTQITFHWIFSDPDGDEQYGYEIWLDNDPDFSGSKFNYIATGKSSSYTLDLREDLEGDWLLELAWNEKYYWKVRVSDGQAWSDWSEPVSFKMPAHANPSPNFEIIPESPSVGEVVEFNQRESRCYNGGEFFCEEGGTNIKYFWDFGKSNGETSTLKGNPTTTYDNPGEYTVKLKITDTSLTHSPNYCECKKTLKIEKALPLPEWKEIPPF